MKGYNSRIPSPRLSYLEETLAESLERVASLFPDTPAVVLSNSAPISFEAFFGITQTAAEKIRPHASPTVPIAGIQSLGVELLASWFSCGLAGAPLLLLDPDIPDKRLAELIQTAGTRCALIDETTQHKLPRHINRVCLKDAHKDAADVQTQPLRADQPSLIFPTSGSTEKPKLIAYSARILQARVQASIGVMGIKPGDRVLIAGSHGNFGYLHHALVFLLAGGSVCLCDIRRDGVEGVFKSLLTAKVGHLRVTPSLFRTLANLPNAREAFQNLTAIRFSGEPLLTEDFQLARKQLPLNCRIQNIYGSTESALFVWSDTDGFDTGKPHIPIGQPYPLWRYQIKPLQEDHDDSSTGELITSSRYQAIGDWTRTGILTHRFPVNENAKDERLYATGDIVQQQDNGQLLVLGRVNQLVKVNGQRVSIPEVEHHLRALKGIIDAVVLEIPGGGGLIGFVQGLQERPSVDAVRRALGDRLPGYMVPRQIIPIDRIPLLPGGKADRQALLKRALTDALSQTDRIFAAKPKVRQAASELEFSQLFGIWKQVLKRNAIDIETDFFSLGGDSLCLLELRLCVEKTFGTSFSMRDFFADPTLPGLAKQLKINVPRGTVQAEGLSLRVLRDQNMNSSGQALIMPGWKGNAEICPFEPLDCLSQYALSALDIRIEHGTLLHSNRWLQVALKISAGIQSGAFPPPDLIMGFSIGGLIGWIVACQLSNTPFRPKLILLIDAPPLHKFPHGQSILLKQGLHHINNATIPPVLHIRRDRFPPRWLGNVSSASGTRKEGLTGEILIPTCEHVDFRRPEVISLASRALGELLNQPERPQSITIKHSIETQGGVIFTAITENKNISPQDTLAIIQAFTPATSMRQQCAFLWFLLQQGRWKASGRLFVKIAGAFLHRIKGIKG